jgi:DHA1 family inner membrane transport protein
MKLVGGVVRAEVTVTRSATAFTALAAGGFAIGTTEFVTMGLLPQIADGLDVSIPAAGRVISAYALGVVVGAPLLAVLTARVSRTRLLLVLMGAFTLGNVASALAPSYPTLMLARFLSGLPHGAYFGIAALVAASMADPSRRGRAVVMPMLGLTAAIVAVIGITTMILVWFRVPFVAALEGAAPREELRALAKPQVWLTLMIGAVGFGGMFAVYSYIAPILTHTSGWSTSAVPIALATFGVGMTFGTVAGGRLADWSIPRSLLLGFAATLVTLVVFPFAARSTWGVGVGVLLLGFVTSATVGALQLRLMDVAGEGAASLGASLNHSSLNLANASGAFFGGVVIDAGYGWTSPAVVGSAMAATGLTLSAISVLAQRRTRRRREFAAEQAAELSGAAA